MTGLITGWVLDGRGGGTEVGLAGAPLPDRHEPGVVWIHLDALDASARETASRVAEIPETALESLFAPDTRPRCEPFRDGVLLNLRGVNLNPGADPDDMISVRVWVSSRRIVSARRHKLMTVDDIRRRLAAHEGLGPRTAGEFVAQLADGLATRLEKVIEGLDERLDGFEDALASDLPVEALGAIRREVVVLRRFIAPQQGALSRLVALPVDWLADADRANLRSVLDDVTRCLEDLDAIRDRAAIIKDATVQKSAERTNRTMYLLTILTGLFLPLTFFTGLLGINVGGIPGSNDDGAFWIVACGLLLAAALEWFVLKKRKVL